MNTLVVPGPDLFLAVASYNWGRVEYNSCSGIDRNEER